MARRRSSHTPIGPSPNGQVMPQQAGRHARCRGHARPASRDFRCLGGRLQVILHGEACTGW